MTDTDTAVSTTLPDEAVDAEIVEGDDDLDLENEDEGDEDDMSEEYDEDEDEDEGDEDEDEGDEDTDEGDTDVAPEPKRRGRPKLTDEEKAARKAARESGEKSDSPNLRDTKKTVAKKAPKEAEKSDYTESQARRVTEKLKTNFKSNIEALADAYQKRIWLALNYKNWKEYVDSEFGQIKLNLPPVTRREEIVQLTEKGMSSRAIASGLGVSQMTVVNDLKFMRGEVDENGNPLLVDSERVGEDGKVYSGEGHTSGGRGKAPLDKRFDSAVTRADKAVGDLLDLSADFPGEEDNDMMVEIRKQRQSLGAILDMLTTVINRLDES